MECSTTVLLPLALQVKLLLEIFFHFILRITSDGKIFTKSLTCMASGSSTMVEHSIAEPEFWGLNPGAALNQGPVL